MCINEIIHDLGLTDEDLAKRCHTDIQVVKRWLQGTMLPDRGEQEKLAELAELVKYLVAVLPKVDQRREWLDTELMFLGGLTPRQAICAGYAGRARAAISAAQSGVYL